MIQNEIASESTAFLYSVILGFAAGMIFGFFRMLRLAFQHPTFLVFVEDILFFILFSVLTVLFLFVFTSGVIRAYVFIGSGIGFLIYYFTLGKLLPLIEKRIFKAVKRVFQLIYSALLSRIINKISFECKKGVAIIRKTVIIISEKKKQSEDKKQRKKLLKAAKRCFGARFFQ